jgi:hypothetical protein
MLQRRVLWTLSAVISIGLAALLAGCAGNLAGGSSALSSGLLIAWLFLITAVGALTTGCGSNNTSPSFTPNTFYG